MDWKKVGNYALYVVPLYGFYDQFIRKSKGERSKAGIVFSSVLAAGFVAKLTLAYVGKGVVTKNWNPFDFNQKEKTEQVENISKKDKTLEEKTLKLDCFE